MNTTSSVVVDLSYRGNHTSTGEAANVCDLFCAPKLHDHDEATFRRYYDVYTSDASEDIAIDLVP